MRVKRMAWLLAVMLMCGVCFAEFDGMTGAVFSPLDKLGRAGVAFALLSPETLDGGNRESIDGFSPSGFRQAENGQYVWERCHLIGAQLAKGTERLENLITGTREMNHGRMLEIENAVAVYIRETGNHVLYRVEPMFVGSELVCRGVWIQAHTLEDDGLRISEICLNVQEGVDIDYLTGEILTDSVHDEEREPVYVLNTRSMRFHRPDCKGAAEISEKNRLEDFTGDRERLIELGYVACGMCAP